MRPHPREKTGRNDPCPCGSGKKYKQCCLSKTTLAFPGPEKLDTPWSRQRDACDRLNGELGRILKRDFADAALDAWLDFNQNDDPVSLNEMPHEISIFSPYVLFEWDPERPRRSTQKPQGGVVVQAYLKKAASHLSDLEHLILEQAITRPVSFYEIIRVHPGRGVLLRDLLIGEETEIEEHSGSKMMRSGDVYYAQIWILPEVATFGRLAPIPIPPDWKVEIIKLRAQLKRKIKRQNRELAAADLTWNADEIRTVYLDIRDALTRPPKLQNTDGEPFLSHKIHFNTQSAQSTFDALAPLAWGIDKEALLEESERYPDGGSLRSIEFAWLRKGNKMHPSWESTVLGHLKIFGKTLLVEVNSASRAKRIREEIEKRLGSQATHVGTETKTPEQMMKQAKQRKALHRSEEEIDQDELMRDPEIRRQIEAEVQKQVEGWVRTKVPALGGRTPLQAVADQDGREMVEALLQGWERQNEVPGSSGIVRPDINALRRLLNLPVKTEARMK